MPAPPLIRIVDASLGSDAQVRVVVSRVSDPDKLQRAWSSSGATIDQVGDRIHAITTVEALARAAGRSLDRDEAMLIDRGLRDAVSAWTGPTPGLKARGRPLPTDHRPLVMGIINITPDSFADGGSIYPDGHPGKAIDAARALVAEGADVIDVGGESTRPGAEPVAADVELSRVIPIVRALVSDGVCVSIDTRKAAVAEQALAEGASIVNDVGGASEPDLLAVTAKAGAVYVLMHTRGTPQDMAGQVEYEDVVAEVYEFLVDGLARCDEAGVDPEQIVVDPGIGFAKTAEQSLTLLRATAQFRGLGRPVLVGASRKSFMRSVGAETPTDRLPGSLATAAVTTAAGAAFLRVHDVASTVAAARTAHAIATGETAWNPINR
ncbi:dihydropteroate synthase [Euzebya tangerina]|uniref:dihydropteroate synthase n=1 Tax=Euzebya tangerina TaxID=591198 RepID=UPI001F0CB455|nr:dihydropteroate synthase [Euzebya tangerina]